MPVIVMENESDDVERSPAAAPGCGFRLPAEFITGRGSPGITVYLFDHTPHHCESGGGVCFS
jgi:hypothetical protein